MKPLTGEGHIETREAIPYHCDRRMKVSTSLVQERHRIRYWKCSSARCDYTAKTVDDIPPGHVARIPRSAKRR